jgi:hypothetical protein
MVGFMDSIMPSSVGFSLFHKDCNFFFPAETQQVSQKPSLIFFMLWKAMAQLYRNQACPQLCLEVPVKPAPYTYSYIRFSIWDLRLTQFMKINPTH